MLLAAGCGGEPRVAPEVAGPLARRADETAAAIEAGDPCGAREVASGLQRSTIAAINDGEVPEEIQEELLGAVNELLEGISCSPPRVDRGVASEARDLGDRLREGGG